MSNKLKKSKTLELLPETGTVMSSMMQMVQMTGLQETIESSMAHMTAHVTIVANLGCCHLALDSRTTGLGDIYQLAKDNEEQQQLE